MECNVAMDSFKNTCKHLQAKIKPIHFSSLNKSDLQNIVIRHKRICYKTYTRKQKNKWNIELIQPSRTIKKQRKKNIKIQNKEKNKEENWKRENLKRNELELWRKAPNLDLQNEEKKALQATNRKDMNTITTWSIKERVPQGWKWQCKA